jgi:hypothetical protein
MKTVVVYESMYGNTHLVAEAIAAGVGDAAGDGSVAVVSVHDAGEEVVEGADLLVVGGPTHVHGMSRESTRRAAADAAQKPESDLSLDPDAEGPGLRDWFDGLGHLGASAAAFDTRMKGPAALTGRASKGIAKRLRDHGGALVVQPKSFLVTNDNHLLEHEEEHAREWGKEVAAAVGNGRPATRRA